jgi:hypothetical protein
MVYLAHSTWFTIREECFGLDEREAKVGFETKSTIASLRRGADIHMTLPQVFLLYPKTVLTKFYRSPFVET